MLKRSGNTNSRSSLAGEFTMNRSSALDVSASSDSWQGKVKILRKFLKNSEKIRIIIKFFFVFFLYFF